MPRSSSSKSSSKATSYRGHAKTEPQDALDVLADDHKRVVRMFDEFEQMKEDNDPDDESKQLLVENTCAELTIHAQVEEELFYPALREAIDDLDLLDEAEVEHASAKQLITELAAMQPEDDLYDAKFTVLGEYVKHHIQEEEKEMFPKAKKADLDLEGLGDEIRQRKLELREELGIAPAETVDDEDEEPAAKTKAGRRVH
ncbi:hemerythrin domain-containing protein [Noviherbaspirillum sp. UKPF54]|uniref:hemerythrin domain-containing protein n=1 Tax=Noviherbaspirillum sp. UKPF54 TaxID=2601898 RepID=UPI0011B14E59|nr:hemerythrin domain-containing protein [Noviherbaspirillum sp. UKPF54]